MQYFVKIGGKENGPVTPRLLKVLADNRQIKPTDYVRKANSDQWHLAGQVKGLFAESIVEVASHNEQPEEAEKQPVVPDNTEKALHIAKPRSTVVVAACCATAVVILASITLWVVLSETPRSAYRNIVAHAEAGEWEDVWNRIDRRSQAKFEASIEMLTGLAAAFKADDETLRSLPGKEWFLRLAANDQAFRNNYVNREVDSVEVDGDQATLHVWVSEANGKGRSKSQVAMLYEDGMWKLSMAKDKARDDTRPRNTQAPQETPPQANVTSPLPLADADFRNTKWGMSLNDVRRQETAELVHESQGTLGYKDRIAGNTCTILYIFVNNMLVRAKYVITEQHSNNTDHITDYESLGTLLAQKYGAPANVDVLWKNDLYRDEPAEYGIAIAVGHLAMYQKWDTPLTKVFHYIDGDNFEITHGVEYISKAYEALEDNARTRETLDDL